MTKIVSFNIEGLAGRHEPVGLQLSPQTNVLFGLNGTGKTSLLKILYSAVQNKPHILENVPFRSAEVVIYSENQKREIRRTITKRLSGTALTSPSQDYEIDVLEGSEHEPADPENLAWKSRPQTFTRPLKVTYLPTSRLFAIPSLTHSSSPRDTTYEREERLNQSFAAYMRTVWRRFANGVLGDVRSIQETGLADILQSLFVGNKAATTIDFNASLDPDRAYRKAKEFLSRQHVPLRMNARQFKSRLAEDPRLARVVADIDEIERRIEEAEEPLRALRRLLEQFVTEGKRIEFSYRDISIEIDGQDIPLSSLSSGEKQLVFLLVSTMQAGVSTIIIDEPELSMHIDWQRELLSAMRTINPETQIIVATHSPEIMANIRDEEIFAL